MNWEEQLGLKFTAFFAGIIGGVISLTFEAHLSFLRALTLILIGGSTAGYSFAFADHYLNIDHKISGFFGFTIGLVSMRLVNVLISLANAIQKEPVLLLSIPKIFEALKNGFRDTTNSDGNISSASVNIYAPREDNNQGLSDIQGSAGNDSSNLSNERPSSL